MTLKNPFEVNQPVRILFGSGQITRIGEVARQFGRRAYFLTMQELECHGLTEPVKDHLKASGLEVTEFNRVEAEPTCKHIDDVAAEIRDAQPEVLIALGGGSVMDVAKAAAIGVTHAEPVWQYVDLSNRPHLPIDSDVVPVVAVPTTAGTGSEVTPYAVVSNHETIQKGTIKSPFIFPKVAIIDPELTVNLPKELTASTGVDAFAHALESYLNVKRRTAFSDMVAEEAMKIIYQTLPAAVERGQDLNFRARMAWGSMLAGMAIANAGTTVAHALAQPLGARLNLPHSLTVAIFTLPVLRHTWQHDPERFARLAGLLEEKERLDLPLRERAKQIVRIVGSFLSKVGMKRRMRDYDLPNDIPELVTRDVFNYMSRPLKQHPKRFTRQEIREIIDEAF